MLLDPLNSIHIGTRFYRAPGPANARSERARPAKELHPSGGEIKDRYNGLGARYQRRAR